MDPITIIVAAVALGASAGLKGIAATAVTDAYGLLKQLIMKRYRHVDLTSVEKSPDSQAKRGSLAENLAEAGAHADAELLEAARQLLAEVKIHAPAAAAAVGVDLERVEAAALRIRNVDSAGTGVRLRDGKFAGDIDIDIVRSGEGGSDRP